jgi:hypothetical protein
MLKERLVMPKPKKEEVSEQFKRAKEPALAIGAQPTDKKLSKEFSRGDVIVVKFKEGSRIRLEGGKFNFQPGNITESDLSLLERGKINLDKVKSGIQKVKKLVEDDPEITLERMFKRNEAELEKERSPARSTPAKNWPIPISTTTSTPANPTTKKPRNW